MFCKNAHNYVKTNGSSVFAHIHHVHEQDIIGPLQDPPLIIPNVNIEEELEGRNSTTKTCKQ